jgi:hypothetical protein
MSKEWGYVIAVGERLNGYLSLNAKFADSLWRMNPANIVLQIRIILIELYQLWYMKD